MIQEKVKVLLKIREEVARVTLALGELREKRDLAQSELIGEMKNQGFSSIKADNTSVAIAHKKTFKITDEKEVINFIREKGLEGEYLAERLNEYAPKAIEEFVKQGEEVKGTEIVETEYMSIRNNKELK